MTTYSCGVITKRNRVPDLWVEVDAEDAREAAIRFAFEYFEKILKQGIEITIMVTMAAYVEKHGLEGALCIPFTIVADEKVI